jgi:signal transduction histidine kinase
LGGKTGDNARDDGVLIGPSASIRPWQTLLDELRAEFEIREAELSLLHKIDLAILSSDRALPETLEFIAAESASLLAADEAQIYLRRGTALQPAVGDLPTSQSRSFAHESSIFARCTVEKEPLIVAHMEAEFPGAAVPVGDGAKAPFQSLVAVPILLEETVLGVLCVVHRERARFQQTHVEIAEAIAAQIAIALEHAELFDQASLFQRVDGLIFSQEETEDVLQSALDAVFEELRRLDYAEVELAQLLFLRDDPDELEIVHSTEPRDVGLPVSVDDSVSGRALNERRTIVVNDVSADPLYKRMLGSSVESEIAIPILIGADDLAIGVLNVESPTPNAFGGVYQLLLERFARKITMLLAVTKLRADTENALEAHHAAELMIAVGDQAGNMVHRLNNVMGAMRVRIKEIQMHCADAIEASDFLRESLEHLAEGVEETLELPKRVQNFLAKKSELSDFDTNEAISRALAGVRVPENVDVVTSFAEDIPPVRTFSLDVVAENLIRNAVDAMEDGGVLTIASSVVVVPDLPGGRVELTFEDTGSGMSPETRGRLFEINFTTKPRKEGKGMGVGLWWVRQWVRRSGGEIEVETQEGKGTKFVIKLPLVFDDDGTLGKAMSIQKGG